MSIYNLTLMYKVDSLARRLLFLLLCDLLLIRIDEQVETIGDGSIYCSFHKRQSMTFMNMDT